MKLEAISLPQGIACCHSDVDPKLGISLHLDVACHRWCLLVLVFNVLISDFCQLCSIDDDAGLQLAEFCHWWTDGKYATANY